MRTNKNAKSIGVRKIFFASLMTFGALLLLSTGVSAAPAPNIEQQFTQPNGVSFAGTLRGDEFFHFLEAQDGSILTQGDDGYWYYAETRGFAANGEAAAELIPSQTKYHIGNAPSKRSRTTKDQLRNEAFQYRRKEMSAQIAHAGPQPAPGGELQAAYDTSPLGDQTLLVILIDFNDVSIQHEDQWANQTFGTTGKTVKTYYKEATDGKINIVPARETYGSANDGIVRVKLNRNHPNIAFSNNYNDVVAAASSYVDFASYNVTTNDDFYDNPNKKLHIMFIYAGHMTGGDSTPPGIWGFYAGSHMAMGENFVMEMTTIGTFCHELGHSLGLPDLYRTGINLGLDYEQTPRDYSLMDSGSWNYLPGESHGATPALLDAWSLEHLGVISPQAVNLDAITTATVKSWSTGAKNILRVPSGVPDEYFLIECRNKEGFDLALEGYGGVAVYRVNTRYRVSLTDGTSSVVMLMLDIIEDNHIYGGLFYSSRPSGRTYVNANTTPSNKLGEGGGYSWFRFDCLSDSGPSMDVKIQPDKPSGVYAITYNANGGSGGPSRQYKKHGENLILNNALVYDALISDYANYSVPIRQGYAFLGWATSSTATTAQYRSGDTFTANADITLYAVWSQNAFLVTIVLGSGSGNCVAGTTVTITANSAPAGLQFKEWDISPAVNYTDGTSVFSAVAKFIMPAEAVIATAVYEQMPPSPYELTVYNGSGSGKYEANTVVTITANAAPAGQRFKQWDIHPAANFTGGTDAFSAVAKLIIRPVWALTATAVYEPIPPTTYTLTVNSGSGSGSYEAAAGVNITADAAPSGKVFDRWTASGGGSFANANNASTTFIMPAGAATVTANYKDVFKTIFTTKYKATFLNWILFFVCFGWIWMWFS